MHILMTASDGRRVNALLLAAAPDHLRVAIPGRGDTVEIRMVEGRWMLDRGTRVEIGALMMADGMRPAHFLREPQVCAGAAV